jgi:hypothetical protein
MKEFGISQKDAARFLYNKMFEPGGYRYENVDLQSQQPALSTRRGEEGRSICQVGRHAIRLEELHPEMPLDEFVNVVNTVLGALKDHWRAFFVQRCKVQCLAQPNVTRNPLGILASRIGNISDKIAPFGRPPAFFGVRFRFQPWSPEEDEDSQTPDAEAAEVEGTDPPGGQVEQDVPAERDVPVESAGESEPTTEARGYLTVRFEPYQADPSQVWIEVAATYLAQDLMTPDEFSIVETNIRETFTFATEKIARGFWISSILRSTPEEGKP